MPLRNAASQGSEDEVCDPQNYSRDPDGGNHTVWANFATVSVARTVNRQEVRMNKAADEACKAEWEILINQGCWDIDSVTEKSQLVKMNRGIKTLHFGKLTEYVWKKGQNSLRTTLGGNTKEGWCSLATG